MRFFLSLLGIVAGFMVTYKADAIMRAFGRIPWAEEKLGVEGGTRLFWKLIGIIIILFAIMYLVGAEAGFFGMFGRLFGGAQTIEPVE